MDRASALTARAGGKSGAWRPPSFGIIGGVEGILGEFAGNPRYLVVPGGLMDVHVHLREPGMEQAETRASGAAAAAAGGFTWVVY